MLSSGKARPENAELERRVKRRPHRLQRNRWPPSSVVPSFVTITDLQRRHAINTPSSCQATLAIPLQENHWDTQQRKWLLGRIWFGRGEQEAGPLCLGRFS